MAGRAKWARPPCPRDAQRGRDQIIGLRTASDGRIRPAVKVGAPPEDGAANETLRALIAGATELSRSAVAIVRADRAGKRG